MSFGCRSFINLVTFHHYPWFELCTALSGLALYPVRFFIDLVIFHHCSCLNFYTALSELAAQYARGGQWLCTTLHCPTTPQVSMEVFDSCGPKNCNWRVIVHHTKALLGAFDTFARMLGMMMVPLNFPILYQATSLLIGYQTSQSIIQYSTNLKSTDGRYSCDVRISCFFQ